MKLSICEIKSMLNNTLVFPESNVIEYKVNIHSNMMDKYIETICAFLNSNGGTIIFGVDDSLKPIGLKHKTFDKLLLQFDNIIHQNLIYGLDSNDNQHQINKNNIDVHIIKNNLNQVFIVVDVNIIKLDITYRLKNGNVFYRLHASNYLNKIEQVYTEQMLNNKLNILKRDYQKIIQDNLKKYNKELDAKQREIMIYIKKNKELEYKLKSNDLEFPLKNKEIKKNSLLSLVKIIFPCISHRF